MDSSRRPPYHPAPTSSGRYTETLMPSHIVDLGGPVHYADFGDDGPPIVCIHGLSGSHVNWLAVGPALARSGRVLAPDLAGFGLTPPSGRSSSVEANRALLDQFLR